MNEERERTGQAMQAGLQKAALGQASGAIQTMPKPNPLDAHHKNLCEFRDRLSDCNNMMRDVAIFITGNNPIPSGTQDETPTPEGMLNAINATMGDIETQLQDYAKIVNHFQAI